MKFDDLDVFIWNRWRHSEAKGDDLRLAKSILKTAKKRGVLKSILSILNEDVPYVVIKIGRFMFQFERYDNL